MSADNKAVIRRFLEEFWNQGNLAVADEVLAADYIRHDVATPGFGTGRESEKSIATLYRGAFPDLSLAIEALIAEGDLVAARWTVRGTHQGDLGGLRATGKQITVPGISIARISGGKIVEGWVSWDAQNMMQQLGVPQVATTGA